MPTKTRRKFLRRPRNFNVVSTGSNYAKIVVWLSKCLLAAVFGSQGIVLKFAGVIFFLVLD